MRNITQTISPSRSLKPSHGCHSDRVHPPLLSFACLIHHPSYVSPYYPLSSFLSLFLPPTVTPLFASTTLPNLPTYPHAVATPLPLFFPSFPASPIPFSDTASADIKLRYQLPRRQTTARSPAMNLRVGARVLCSLSDDGVNIGMRPGEGRINACIRANPAYPQQSSLQFGTRCAKSTQLVTFNCFLTFYFTLIENFFHSEADLLLRCWRTWKEER